MILMKMPAMTSVIRNQYYCVAFSYDEGKDGENYLDIITLDAGTVGRKNAFQSCREKLSIWFKVCNMLLFSISA